jgi:hypothetical protein
VATYPRQGRRRESTHPHGGNPQPRAEGSRGPFGTARPLSLAAVDAAISESIGHPVRRDRLARDDGLYRVLVRRAIAEGSLRFNCTYAELARGAGYDVPRLTSRASRKRARQLRVSTIYRALRSLEHAGLVRSRGRKRDNGQWRCLSVGLTPAAFGPCSPFGRSPRAPRRLANGRISFTRRNGTSPPVATAKNVPESVSVGARARAGPPKEASSGGMRRFAAAQALIEAPVRPNGPAPWPLEHFDLTDQELVELVELFEDRFGIAAQFSFRRHGPLLRRVLERFDRFTGPAGDRSGYSADGRHFRHGAGFRHAAALLERAGRSYRLSNPTHPRRPRSLAYFLPRLDQESKARRRQWKRENPRPITSGPPAEGGRRAPSGPFSPGPGQIVS